MIDFAPLLPRFVLAGGRMRETVGKHCSSSASSRNSIFQTQVLTPKRGAAKTNPSSPTVNRLMWRKPHFIDGKPASDNQPVFQSWFHAIDLLCNKLYYYIHIVYFIKIRTLAGMLNRGYVIYRYAASSSIAILNIRCPT
ncbi:hypothetical protein TKWG_18140 [Advenella kashmirensis WT001]|uniref:Uncharacterized protein n=1 Tax=Advenella kashmirensis (strain DSM 17095 / LMG 22695 / WT001) TaxID=1036672 RepID=I3UER4_ADVKW|nr:hypothetical protein TKWG_18140 [Advenella kashmirensis WT001]